MAAGKAKVKNPAGIHVRPSGVIREAFEGYAGKIVLKAKGMEIDPRNVLGLIALGLQENDTLEVFVEGPGDKEVCAELIALIEKRFDFPPRE